MEIDLANIIKQAYCFFDSDIWLGNQILFKPQTFLITLCFFNISYQFTYYAGIEICTSNPSIRDGVLRSGMLLYLHLILK